MRNTIRGAILATGTLVALSGLITATAAAPLTPCVPNSQPTARGFCLPLSRLGDLAEGFLLSRSPNCAAEEFCAFLPPLRSPALSAVRND
ncbi:hypothetical protein OHA84_36855 [Streptomyces sp. NBC_00513]|uniref:hypothetical protein n=1 Tax=unclassified Streptomyces TaxID=2593676 RepID=UPI002252DA6A|nr:hypothetical protein [Streptomyces sp. NBC_00424]MCX5078654.1 hypothetical protein [Streptomyces sp. NBC_00424]WUD39097.1 hypothetical protein OHA84_00445 [Streptomyces sp. NBC_00513]WUD45632.1 hypothetical protein OHA84_36855 [Streptomyces sp. NBC_00513]